MEESLPEVSPETPTRKVKDYHCKYCGRTNVKFFYTTNKSSCMRCISVVRKLQRGKEESIEEENREIATKIKAMLKEKSPKKRVFLNKKESSSPEEKEEPPKEEIKKDRIKTLEERVVNLEQKLDAMTQLLQQINTKLSKEPPPSPPKEEPLKEKTPSPKKPPVTKIIPSKKIQPKEVSSEEEEEPPAPQKPIKKKSLPKSALSLSDDEEEEEKLPKRESSTQLTEKEMEEIIAKQARANIKKGINTYAKLHEKYLQTYPPSPLPPRFKNPYMAKDAYTRLLRKYKIEL